MKALLLVDIQNDFLPSGSLPVVEGDQIVPIINQLTTLPFDLIIATKDWHPVDHESFAVMHNKNPGEQGLVGGIEQFLWPVHCVQETEGAEFASGLDVHKIAHVIHKGTEKDIDSYSAFYDNGMKRQTGLNEFLQQKGVKEVYIAGLATDYCVKYSVLDALMLGFQVYVIEDACRGVNLKKNDSAQALKDMQLQGAVIVQSHELINL